MVSYFVADRSEGKGIENANVIESGVTSRRFAPMAQEKQMKQESNIGSKRE